MAGRWCNFPCHERAVVGSVVLRSRRMRPQDRPHVSAAPESAAYDLPLYVEQYGEGDRQIMLLHGFAANSCTWRSWIGALAKEHRVWSLELKGHGSAPAPPDDLYSPHDHADLVHRLIVQEDLRELTLVGHSMGGGIALLVALQLLEEERLERLVLVSSAAYPQRLPPFVGLAGRGRLSEWGLHLFPKRLLIRQVLRSVVFDRDAVTEAQVGLCRAILQQSPPHGSDQDRRGDRASRSQEVYQPHSRDRRSHAAPLGKARPGRPSGRR